MTTGWLRVLLAAMVLGGVVQVIAAGPEQPLNPPAEQAVVINEIHCNPDIATELVEFVELYNRGTTSVNLSGWFFDKGITYVFPAGTTLAAHGYLIVAQNPAALRTKWASGAAAVPANLIYGPFTGRLSGDGETLQLCDAAGQVADEVDYQVGFPWPTVGDPVPASQPGAGPSLQLVNPDLDNELGGSWRSAYPTPAKANAAVYLDNAPPLLRQVNHAPKQPQSGETVTITAKATDADGVPSLQLLYQVVEPGNYIPVTLPNYPARNPATVPNPDYEKGWTAVAMHDDGLNGDLVAGDDVYTVQLPTSVQKHRRLVRYALAATDRRGVAVEVPYADDPQPNFAYFVYDGVPAWKGAIQPGSSDPQKSRVVTYNAELMQSLPVYHLLSRAVDVRNCQYSGSYDNTEYYFSGTLVYDGAVYDNIHYRIRGQASTFTTGKGKWKLDFHRGHYFQARDDYGRKYHSKWDKMNVGTGTCPWWQYPHPGGWDQGTQGMVMNEALAFRLYNMAGVPSCTTNYFHFRVIDGAVETDPANQYEGDFWGLYFTIEQADGAYLDEHGLPDGNVYRLDGGYNLTHQGETQVANGSDISTFISTYNSRPPAAWWLQNVNLANYYSSKAIGVAVNDSDRRPEANCIYYHNSLTNQWWMLPWDLDLSFEWGTHYGDWEHWRYALSYPEYDVAYRNRARELLDLLFNGDQAAQVVDEIAALIATPYSSSTFVEANRAMWDYHPQTNKKGQFYLNNEFLKTRDWPGLVEYYKAFLTPAGLPGVSGTSYGAKALVAEAADPAIPDTPIVTYAGPEGFPLDGLAFHTTGFQSPLGAAAFAALQWRIAQVETGSQYVPPVYTEPATSTLIASQSPNWRYCKGDTGEPSNPADAWCQPGFDDSSWPQGQAGIGYGDNDDNTVLTDMQSRYSSIYLRKQFTTANVADIAQLRLRLYVDDGCIIWINGAEVARFNVPDGFVAYNALSTTAVGDAAWQELTLPAPFDYLVEGQNVMALQVLNSSLGSSDLSVDVTLMADLSLDTPEPGAPPAEPPAVLPAYPARPGHYEIDAVWESEEITPFTNTITIPASVVEPGSTYRVRCRMKDMTGRWSHWSAPVQFVAGP